MHSLKSSHFFRTDWVIRLLLPRIAREDGWCTHHTLAVSFDCKDLCDLLLGLVIRLYAFGLNIVNLDDVIAELRLDGLGKFLPDSSQRRPLQTRNHPPSLKQPQSASDLFEGQFELHRQIIK